MIPDRMAMQETALAIEQTRADAEGWDAPPLLALVLVMEREPERESYAVLPYFLQPQDVADNPGAALMFIGGKLRQPDAPPMLPPSYRRRFCGVLFSGEGWQRTDMSSAQADRPFADIPGSKEVRFVHIIDCGGRYYNVTRIRGEEPKLTVVEPEDTDQEWAGRVIVGLRDFVMGVGRHLRPDAWDEEAVARIAREDKP